MAACGALLHNAWSPVVATVCGDFLLVLVHFGKKAFESVLELQVRLWHWLAAVFGGFVEGFVGGFVGVSWSAK